MADAVVRRRDSFEARLTAGLPTKDVVRALERVRDSVRPKG